MPKINAATVAEHREQQVRNILDAAHDLLKESPNPPTIGAIAARAGLSRPALYVYFESREELFFALVEDIFPRWTEHVTQSMAAVEHPADRVRAFAVANLELVDEGAHAVSGALRTLTPSAQLSAHAREMHAQIQAPLVDAVRELGVEPPEPVAELINTLVHGATQMLERGQRYEAVLAGLDELLLPFVAAHRASAPASASASPPVSASASEKE